MDLLFLIKKHDNKTEGNNDNLAYIMFINQNE